MGEMKNTHNIFVGKRERKRTLQRPRRRWDDIIELGLSEMGERVRG
jgi:hypothetical protein